MNGFDLTVLRSRCADPRFDSDDDSASRNNDLIRYAFLISSKILVAKPSLSRVSEI